MRTNDYHKPNLSLLEIIKLFTPWLAFVGLVCYGTFYHISSSEFWPITMSKTWLPGEHFEYSMLQKPLFTLFLSIFHIIPLSDAQHLLLLKFIFSVLGFFSIYFFIRALQKLKNNLNTKNSSLFIFTFIICVVSPTILNNFFRIRSDQLSIFIFSLFLFYIAKKRIIPTLICTLLIIMSSVKSLIYLPIILFFLLSSHDFLTTLIKKNITLSSLFFMSLIVWPLALNIHSFYYFLETLKSNHFPNEYLKIFLQSEWPILIASILVSIRLIFFKKKLKDSILAACSIYSLVLIVAMPQSYPFFMESLLLISIAPLILYFFDLQKSNSLFKKKMVVVYVIFCFCYSYSTKFLFLKNNLYTSNIEQIQFIKNTSNWLSKNQFLTYLDGMGIMPKQNFDRCFISPDDEESNSSCKEKIKLNNADVVIVTQRLAYLNQDLFPHLNQEYIQIKPNIWIKKTRKNMVTTAPETETIKPIVIFGFD